ncbi:MAG: adenylosuccinate synthase [Thermoplasmatota archaeon]
MAVTIVVGAQFGDEGKGKVVDYLAEDVDVVARYQGGANAGHTVVVGNQKYALHLLPSGVVHEGIRNVIGNGVVVDPVKLLEEIDQLEALGRRFNLAVSDRAHVVLPIHSRLDGIAEDKGQRGIGTTRRGIGPAYTDKAARLGIRMCDLTDSVEALTAKLSPLVSERNAVLRHYGADPYDAAAIARELAKPAERLAPLIEDTVELLNDAVDDGDEVLLEGAQGTFLDLDHGTYPFVTSSSTSSGGACVGTGLPPTKIDDVIGVVKAYTTRVGSGPFPTELKDAVGEHLVTKGQEVGTTTGRRRRTGWLDLVLLRRSVRVNGFTGLAVTKLDVLSGLEKILVCEGYEIDGGETDEVPARAADIARATPIYREYPGFDLKVGSRDLPEKAVTYLEGIEEYLGVPINLVGTGPARDAMVELAE